MSSTPMCPEFNRAVLDMCAWLMPGGYVVSWEAPQTFAALKALMHAGGPMTVWAGASERTVYADPQVNFAFRAWHDWCHWQGDYDLSIDGEAAASSMQRRLLVARYGNGDLTVRWSGIIDAEINGQAQYHARHQRFPDDQRGFVDAYLDNPAAALRRPAW